jgi:hypothetical protein
MEVALSKPEGREDHQGAIDISGTALSEYCGRQE